MSNLLETQNLMKRLCEATDVWDVDENVRLHSLPLIVVGRHETKALGDEDEVRAMYEPVRGRMQMLGGARMVSKYRVPNSATPGMFFAETRSKVLDSKDNVLTEVSASYAVGVAPDGVRITTIILEPEREEVSPVVDCLIDPDAFPPVAA